jgi:rubredoxin
LREKGGMNIERINSGTSADTPPCPSCGRPMRFVRAVPRFAALPELRTYECKGCGVSYTEAIEPDAQSDAAWIEE